MILNHAVSEMVTCYCQWSHSMAAMGTDNWHLDWLEEQSIHVCALMELMCHSIFQFFHIIVVLDPVVIADGQGCAVLG